MPTISGYVDTIKRNNAYYDIHDTGLRNTIGQANGLATLDDNGKLPSTQLPSDTTTSINGNPISISGLKSNQLAINPIITFEPIQAGSGTPSPSNIRAISGYDKIEVLSCGKNLFDKDKAVVNKGMTPTGEESFTGISHSDYIRVKPNTDYYLINVYGGTSYSSSIQFDKSLNIIGAKNISGSGIQSGAITTDANTAYLVINTGATIVNTVQVTEGSTAQSYSAYDKTTSISESLGQTVYGGTLDLRSGKLIDNMNIVNDLSQGTWTLYAANSFFSDSFTTLFLKTYSGICSAYKNCGASVTVIENYGFVGDANGRIYMKNEDYSDATAFTNSLANVQFCAPKKTSTTIQLTPHEISLLKDYAYVSTNGTSIALDYHNGELASLSDVSQLGETVNEGLDYLKGYVEKNVAGNYVTLTATKYEFPCDGYVVLASETSASGVLRVVIQDKNNTKVAFLYMNVTGSYQMQSVFVRKGLTAMVLYTTVDAGWARFIPLP